MSEQNKMDEIKAVHAAANDMWYDILAANAYEYITYLLQEIKRKDEALNEIELILTDDKSTQAIEINQVINRAREAL